MEKVNLGAFLALLVQEAAPHSAPAVDLSDAVLGVDGNLYRYVAHGVPKGGAENDSEYSLYRDQAGTHEPRLLLDDCQEAALRVLREAPSPWGSVWVFHRIYGVTLGDLSERLTRYGKWAVRERIQKLDHAILNALPDEVVELVRQACTDSPEPPDVRDNLTGSDD